MIKVTFNKTCGRCVQSEPLTSGMVGQPVELEYSPDFDGLTLTAVFTNGKTTVDVLNPDKQCVIPHEVLDTVGAVVRVGIYAVKGDELVIPTVYAIIGIVLKGADPSGDVSAVPTLPVWAQLQTLIGDLADLETEAKNNLVAAINEAAQSGGGGGASIAMRVDGGYIQYSTDNGKTWVNLIAEADLKGDKGDAGASGKDGITPTIGDNGNWYIGSTDTGKPSRGEQGAKGEQGPKGDTGPQGDKGDKGDPGKNGTDGHTPVKGTDYWTAADKAEIVNDTKNAINLSSYAKLSDLEPLSRTTSEVTPSQVSQAIFAGTPVVVNYTDGTYGSLAFTNFNIAENFDIIAAQIIVKNNETYIFAELGGNISTNNWFFNTALLATVDIVPEYTSQLTNDSGFLTLDTLPKYGGETE